MHAPIGLLIFAAALGVLVPFGIGLVPATPDTATLISAIRLLSLAVVPLLATRIAYRQGYDRGIERRQ